jgi:hypothetical protein
MLALMFAGLTGQLSSWPAETTLGELAAELRQQGTLIRPAPEIANRVVYFHAEQQSPTDVVRGLAYALDLDLLYAPATKEYTLIPRKDPRLKKAMVSFSKQARSYLSTLEPMLQKGPAEVKEVADRLGAEVINGLQAGTMTYAQRDDIQRRRGALRDLLDNWSGLAVLSSLSPDDCVAPLFSGCDSTSAVSLSPQRFPTLITDLRRVNPELTGVVPVGEPLFMLVPQARGMAIEWDATAYFENTSKTLGRSILPLSVSEETVDPLDASDMDLKMRVKKPLLACPTISKGVGFEAWPDIAKQCGYSVACWCPATNDTWPRLGETFALGELVSTYQMRRFTGLLGSGSAVLDKRKYLPLSLSAKGGWVRVKTLDPIPPAPRVNWTTLLPFLRRHRDIAPAIDELLSFAKGVAPDQALAMGDVKFERPRMSEGERAVVEGISCLKALAALPKSVQEKALSVGISMRVADLPTDAQSAVLQFVRSGRFWPSNHWHPNYINTLGKELFVVQPHVAGASRRLEIGLDHAADLDWLVTIRCRY